MKALVIGFCFLALALWSLMVKPSDVQACVEATGYSADRCLLELSR